MNEAVLVFEIYRVIQEELILFRGMGVRKLSNEQGSGS